MEVIQMSKVKFILDVSNNLTIRTSSNEEKLRIGKKIHNQLCGLEDYIVSNVVLNIDNDCEIKLLVDGAKQNSLIELDL